MKKDRCRSFGAHVRRCFEKPRSIAHLRSITWRFLYGIDKNCGRGHCAWFMITFYSRLSTIVSILIAHVLLTSCRIHTFTGVHLSFLWSFIGNPSIPAFVNSNSHLCLSTSSADPMQHTHTHTRIRNNKSISLERLIVCTNRLHTSISNSTSVWVEQSLRARTHHIQNRRRERRHVQRQKTHQRSAKGKRLMPIDCRYRRRVHSTTIKAILMWYCVRLISHKNTIAFTSPG